MKIRRLIGLFLAFVGAGCIIAGPTMVWMDFFSQDEAIFATVAGIIILIVGIVIFPHRGGIKQYLKDIR